MPVAQRRSGPPHRRLILGQVANPRDERDDVAAQARLVVETCGLPSQGLPRVRGHDRRPAPIAVGRDREPDLHRLESQRHHEASDERIDQVHVAATEHVRLPPRAEQPLRGELVGRQLAAPEATAQRGRHVEACRDAFERRRVQVGEVRETRRQHRRARRGLRLLGGEERHALVHTPLAGCARRLQDLPADGAVALADAQRTRVALAPPSTVVREQ